MWHSYDYGFRRTHLSSYAKTSPIDEKGDWFHASMADQAEMFYRFRTGKAEKPPVHSASHADAVRDDWRSIPAHLLTDRERELALPEIADMSRRFEDNMATAANKKRLFRPKRYSDFVPPQAREISAPVVMPEDIDRLTLELESRRES